MSKQIILFCAYLILFEGYCPLKLNFILWGG
nr:MAG TPA_asm: hypothetical protein [Caudoviricetes sp.]